MKKLLLFVSIFLRLIPVTAQSQITTTGNNVADISNPYAADIVIGSPANGGTRHDASIMWWSYGSANRISSTDQNFNFSAWSSSNPNISLAANVGGYSYFLGNIGIGTTLPSYPIHVNSVQAPSNSQLRIAANGSGSISALNYSPDNTSLGFDVDYFNGAWIARHTSVAWLYKVGGLLKIIGSDGNTVNTPAPQHDYFTVNLATGNIGVGTNSPDQKLSVAGTIHSQAVKVDMTGWSDYVFKPSYNLSSLETVKAYIDENHHLPDMPSEKEVIKNGVDLGEMVKLQQKKIEELTLYLINQEKRIATLENKSNKTDHKKNN